MPSVVIIEDDKVLRESLVECLELNDFRVVGVENALEFYNLISTLPPAVAIVDVGLPDQSGFVLADYIRRNTRIRIVMLTARGALEDRVKGYESGADLYLVKPVKCLELAAAVRSVAGRCEDGENHDLQDSDFQKDTWSFSLTSCELCSPGGVYIRLTDREASFLQILGESEEMRCPRAELLNGLDYQQDEYGDRALNSLVLRLRKKIEKAAEVEAPIRTAHAVGFYFSEPLVIN